MKLNRELVFTFSKGYISVPKGFGFHGILANQASSFTTTNTGNIFISGDPLNVTTGTPSITSSPTDITTGTTTYTLPTYTGVRNVDGITTHTYVTNDGQQVSVQFMNINDGYTINTLSAEDVMRRNNKKESVIKDIEDFINDLKKK